MTNTSCLSEIFFCCDKTPWPKIIWGANGLFYPKAFSQLSREIWTVTWRQELRPRPWMQSAEWFAPLALLSLFSYTPKKYLNRTSNTQNVLAPPHQLLIKEIFHRFSWRGGKFYEDIVSMWFPLF